MWSRITLDSASTDESFAVEDVERKGTLITVSPLGVGRGAEFTSRSSPESTEWG